MREFKWIDWNLQKIDARGLSAEEVEAAFDSVFSLQQRRDGSFQMFGATPSGRRIWVIWRFDRGADEIPDVFGEPARSPIFVITAYERLPMTNPSLDQRSEDRRLRDEQIAAEPLLPPINLPPGTVALPVEQHLAQRQQHPLAVLGVVENGLVRPLDLTVKLAENTRVIVVVTNAAL